MSRLSRRYEPFFSVVAHIASLSHYLKHNRRNVENDACKTLDHDLTEKENVLICACDHDCSYTDE